MWKPGIRTSDDWVSSTRKLPVAFAQVREDPLIDHQLLKELGREARVLMIASGGETAALLATEPIQRLHLVDMNPAQISLSKLKLSLIRNTAPEQRLKLLGHSTMPADQRDRELRCRMADLGIDPQDLGPRSLLAEFGPDHCGRYEWVFARLRELLGDCEKQILDLMYLSDIREQTRRIDPQTELGGRIKQAFADAMGLSNLIAIFGSQATANRVMPFCEHFLTQTSVALRTLAAAKNPFLHSIFLGRFPGPTWPWLSLSPQSELCPLRFSCAAMEKILPSLPEGSYDFVHLSNILDWISADQAARLLRQAHRCLSPGGIVVIRQLNSSLDIPGVPSGFRWMHDLAEQLHRSDRSFFYRALHVGKRR